MFSESQDRVAYGVLGREAAPEQEKASYDPFALDIYVLGKVYESKFLEVRQCTYTSNLQLNFAQRNITILHSCGLLSTI